MNSIRRAALLGVLAASIFISGCATKGYVRKSMESVRGDVTALEQRVDTGDQQSRDLANRAMARADEVGAGSDSLRSMALGWTNTREVQRFRAHFAFNSAVLNEESRATLIDAATSLKSNPNYVAAVYGYADPTGDENYNYILAERRAQAVQRYLVGEAPGDLVRCVTISFGENPPAMESAGLGTGADRRQVVVVLMERVPVGSEQEQLSAY